MYTFSEINTDKLDTLVAQKVLNWTKSQDPAFEPDWLEENHVVYEVGEFSPTQYMEHAMDVVLHLRKKDWQFQLHDCFDFGWRAGFGAPPESEYESAEAIADQPELAICIAALHTAGISVIPMLTPSFERGDLVHVPRGQRTDFFEVLHVDGSTLIIADGHVQITRNEEDVHLICKRQERKDLDKHPLIYYHQKEETK